MEEYQYIIYMYTFPNGKRYIGKTKRSLEERRGKDWTKYKRCRLLWNAIQKYGVDSIHTDILYNGPLTDDDASMLEEEYIEAYKTNTNKYSNPSFGYNLTAGGEGVKDWSPTAERLEALQKQMRENGKRRLGTHISEETRRKLSESHKGIRQGYVMPEETRRKIGRSNSREFMSEETHMRKVKAKQKPVLATNTLTGESIVFDGLLDAANFFGVARSTISRWISGDRHTTTNYTFSKYSPTTTE